MSFLLNLHCIMRHHNSLVIDDDRYSQLLLLMHVNLHIDRANQILVVCMLKTSLHISHYQHQSYVFFFFCIYWPWKKKNVKWYQTKYLQEQQQMKIWPITTYFLQLLFSKYLLAFNTIWATLSYSFVLLFGKLSKYCAYDDELLDNWIGDFEILSSILSENKQNSCKYMNSKVDVSIMNMTFVDWCDNIIWKQSRFKKYGI